MFAGLLLFNVFILRMKVSYSVGILILVWWLGMLVMIVMNNFERREFYGEGNYDQETSLIALPRGVIGNVLAPSHFVKAKLDKNGTYNCDGVTTLNGKHPTYGIVDDEDQSLMCCRHNPEYDSYLAPFKIVGDKLHILCSSYPFHQEVITDAPRDFLSRYEARKIDATQ
ncbi:putative Rieske domain-containing protein [Vibrio crassostreae]|nr:conserved hypothetical protein [Vibrio chagasii]CAK2840864.1 putative Rieske domain-containing protein [Vibrio crassostreae]